MERAKKKRIQTEQKEAKNKEKKPFNESSVHLSAMRKRTLMFCYVLHEIEKDTF